MDETNEFEFGNESACSNCGDEWAELDDNNLCPECVKARETT